MAGWRNADCSRFLRPAKSRTYDFLEERMTSGVSLTAGTAWQEKAPESGRVMFEMLGDLSFAILMSSGGAGAGWALHRAFRGAAAELPEEQRLAKEVLAG